MLKVYLVCILTLCFQTKSLATDMHLSNLQLENRELILSHSTNFTKYKTTILAISAQESSIGIQVIGDKGKSFGLTHLQCRTIRFLAKRDKSLRYILGITNDGYLKTIVLSNKKLQIEITCKLFEYYRKRYGYEEAKIRYNGYWIYKKGKRYKNYAYSELIEKWKRRLR